MEKQPQRPNIIDNGLKILIERRPGLRSRYVSGTKKKLRDMPGAKVYCDSQIKRIVNNKVELNLENKVVKDAFMEVYYELYPDERPKVPQHVWHPIGDLVTA